MHSAEFTLTVHFFLGRRARQRAKEYGMLDCDRYPHSYLMSWLVSRGLKPTDDWSAAWAEDHHQPQLFELSDRYWEKRYKRRIALKKSGKMWRRVKQQAVASGVLIRLSDHPKAAHLFGQR